MSESAEESCKIKKPRGRHARAAAKLVRLAGEHAGKVELEKDGQRVDAKSIMGVLLLVGSQGSQVSVCAHGPGAALIVTRIGELIADRFGEAE
ncbi:MAG: HPr family phosphocarrier protein [Myxococcota bacterium]